MKKNSRLKNLILGCFVTVVAVCFTVPALAAVSRNVVVTSDGIKFIVNGTTINTKDKDGKALEPILIDGVVYLPAQSVGNALDMDVSWDIVKNEIKLTSRNIPTLPSGSSYIGLERAKQLALEHAGISSSEVVFFKSELDYDDGRAEYDVEFVSSNKKYDYAIDAQTGKVISWERKANSNYPPQSSSISQNIISLENAKSLAQAKAPNATMYSCKLDYDDGKQVYEGELREGRTEYDFEIDAITGIFLKWDVDYDN